MMTDEELATEYQGRAQTLRRRAGGDHLDDKTRAELIRRADECTVIAWELAPRRRFGCLVCGVKMPDTVPVMAVSEELGTTFYCADHVPQELR
jgi:hypothetical protein